MTTPAQYTVGQRVWVYDRNSQGRGPSEGAVTKVGRKLFTVAIGPYAQEQVFRIDTGSANDNYGHQWVRTTEEKVQDERSDELVRELRDAGLEIRLGKRLPLATLEAVAAALREVSTS